jgi:hypothetical protein
MILRITQFFLNVPIADKNELERLADIDIAYQLDEFFSTIVQPHKYRKKG